MYVFRTLTMWPLGVAVEGSNYFVVRSLYMPCPDMHSSGCFCNAFGSEHVVGNLVIDDASWPIHRWNWY